MNGIRGIFREVRSIAALVLCILLPLGAATEQYGSKVIYDGGSIPMLKSGSELRLFIESSRMLLRTKDQVEVIAIPAGAITEITYGQDVHRRIGTSILLAAASLGIGAFMLLSKSKKHFIGITWADGEQKGGFAIQCDKSDYRGIIAGLEGITGKKAVDSTTLTVKN